MKEAVEILAPISVGELFDKITILRLKHQKISSEKKAANIAHELKRLLAISESQVDFSPELSELVRQLSVVNEKLWEIEDFKRSKERLKKFDGEFIQAARGVYQLNDARADIKKKIDVLCNSLISEEKSHL